MPIYSIHEPDKMGKKKGKQVVASELPNVEFIADAKVLGQLIRAKRTAMKMKLADCAALCGVGINTLSRLENGNPNATLGSMFAVIYGLGIKLRSDHLPQSGHVAEPGAEWL